MKHHEISWNTVSWNITKLDTDVWLLMFASIIYKDANHLANCIQKKHPDARAQPSDRTVSSRMETSKDLKFRSMGTPRNQPTMTVKGTTKRAICVLLPRATPRERSILSLVATVTAVRCSAALPTLEPRSTISGKLGNLGCDNLWLIGAQMRGQGNQDLFRSISNLRTCFF